MHPFPADFLDREDTVDFRSAISVQATMRSLSHLQEQRIVTLLAHDTLSIGLRIAAVTSVINRLERDPADFSWQDILVAHLPISTSGSVALAGQLVCSDVNTDILVELQDVQSRLHTANALTLSFCRFPAEQRYKGGVHIEVLVGTWRDLCEATVAVISGLQSSPSFDRQSFSSKHATTARDLLSSCANGGSPCVMEDGSLEIPGIAERRRHQRWLVEWPISILLGPTTEEALLVNISAGGFCIITTEPLRIGEVLRFLTHSGRELGGQVAWSKARYHGIKFSQPLDSADPLLRLAKLG